ncbi:uncharacterized protein N7482_002735 [Penicillium canariense]|uniref:Uncharacterized protein n=1 Tax=Penicillium canariense TaxID=189055 RepID=A0A9W9IFT1_9EURO|nr:uncharacterized protein N7482_002735 [Penicillium canariense]KAJ5176858.1 hypothetical protein N7482_002735 [Penicillium canariense]
MQQPDKNPNNVNNRETPGDHADPLANNTTGTDPESVDTYGTTYAAPTEEGQISPNQGDVPSEFDVSLINYAQATNPGFALPDSPGVAGFLSSLFPQRQTRSPNQGLQGYLIQMQLCAGIPPEGIKPMETPNVVRHASSPAMMLVIDDNITLPAIPLASFNGTLDPLPIHPSFPEPPSWRQRWDSLSQHGVTNTVSPFTSAEERETFMRFYVNHFLNPPGTNHISAIPEGDDNENGELAGFPRSVPPTQSLSNPDYSLNMDGEEDEVGNEWIGG